MAIGKLRRRPGMRGVVHNAFGDRMTSVGVLLRNVPEALRHEVEWLDGMHGAAAGLPPISEVPIPAILHEIPRVHPYRPRGVAAELDAGGARARLCGCRPGAWVISPKTGWHWAVWPDGEVGWKPGNVALPAKLQVQARKDIV